MKGIWKKCNSLAGSAPLHEGVAMRHVPLSSTREFICGREVGAVPLALLLGALDLVMP